MGNEMARMLWAQCWQVTLLIFCVGLLSQWLGRNRPHLTHALWVVVLVKALTPPVWSSPSGLFSWLQAPKSSEEILEPIPPEEPPASEILKPPSPDVLAESLVEASEPWTPDVPKEEPRDLSSLIATEVVVAEMSIDAEVTSPAIAPSAESELPASGNFWSQLILAVWIVGALGSLLLVGLRWLVCWREIRKALIVYDPLAQELFETLRARLRVRRKVRLLISQSRIGPAVIGLFRPTVLIPARVMAGKSAADLEPVFAHELIHIRRGDLWVGWLQMLAESVWWFHPLVHFAGRWLKHDAERCCDEEVIGELGLKPARYARVLLDVLELKHILKPVPVLPGVKPVEITSKRLERIMLLGQGCRKRTPWWCWLIMLLTAALTLPGAAFVAEAKDKTRRKDRREAKQTPSASSSVIQTKSYKVGDLIEQLQKDFGLPDEAAARRELAALLKTVAGPIWEAEQQIFSEEGAATPSLKIKGNTLKVHHTPRVQAAIAEQLKLIREHGHQQIVIEARILTVSRESIEKSVNRWEAMPAENPPTGPAERTLWETHDRESAGKPSQGVRTIVEKSVPIRLAILDQPQLKTLIEACQSDARSNLMFCPKVTVFNGQSATIQDLTQRPFVVGISDEGKPRFRVVSEGTSLKVRSVLEDKHIRLESELTFSDIRGVEVIDLPGEEEPLKVQVPEVATTRINSIVKVPDGGSVLLGGLKRLREGRNAAGTPILNKVPYVSRLFKNSDTDHENPDEQLFVLLTVRHLKDRSTLGQWEESFEKAQAMAKEQKRPFLLYFHADWCGPCRSMEADVFQTGRFRSQLGTKILGAKIDIEERRELAARFDIKSVPTTILLSPDGKERERIIGVESLERLVARIQQSATALSTPPAVLKHQTLPYGVTDISDVEVRYAQKAAEIALLEVQKALEANERLPGTVADIEIRRLKLAAERARLHVEQAKHKLKIQQPSHTLRGMGINSDGGVTGSIILSETNVERPAVEPPTDEEVLKALDKVQKAKDSASPHPIERKNVVIVKELVSQSEKEARNLPLTGPAKSQFARFKCSVIYDEVQKSEWPVPFTHSDKTTAVVYIEKPYLARLDYLPAPAPVHAHSQVRPSAQYLQDDVQYFPRGPESAPHKAAPKSWPDLVRQRARSKVSKTQEAHDTVLSQKISLAFKKTPLDEAMTDLAKKAGINIVIDNDGLAEEGITSEHPITLEVENVKVATALKVILEPLSLCYELQDEVLKITSKTRLEIASLITATYPVADLIIPIPQRATLDLRDKEGSEKQTIAKYWNKPAPAIPEPRIYRHPKVAGSDDLIQLIQSTIDPNSWSEKGGSGSIRFFETTLSLVIRQTPKVHEELHDLLKQLRRLQDVQVSFIVQIVDIRHFDAKWLSKLKEDDAVPLTPAETVKIKEHFEKDAVRRWQAPKITLFNGQSVNVVLPDHQSKTGFGVDLSPVIAADRRSIRLGMIINSHADKDQQSSKQLSLKAGESLLVDVAKASRNGTSDGPKVMMLTPTMVVQEEEEELLGTEQK